VINWVDVSMIDREPNRATRWIKEARKDNVPLIVKKAATNSVMRTTVFLAYLLLNVPRTG